MPDELSRGLGDEAHPPIGFADPIAELGLVLIERDIALFVTKKTHAPHRLASLLENDSVGLRCREHVADYFAAVLNACMRGPSGNRANIRILGVAIQFFSIVFVPRAKNEPFGFCLLYTSRCV